ncbi:MAG: hypothetical protein AAF769_01170 [Pseudomonadota bacterium]
MGTVSRQLAQRFVEREAREAPDAWFWSGIGHVDALSPGTDCVVFQID